MENLLIVAILGGLYSFKAQLSDWLLWITLFVIVSTIILFSLLVWLLFFMTHVGDGVFHPFASRLEIEFGLLGLANLFMSS